MFGWLALFPHVPSDSPIELVKMSLIPGFCFMAIIGFRLKRILL